MPAAQFLQCVFSNQAQGLWQSWNRKGIRPQLQLNILFRLFNLKASMCWATLPLFSCCLAKSCSKTSTCHMWAQKSLMNF